MSITAQPTPKTSHIRGPIVRYALERWLYHKIAKGWVISKIKVDRRFLRNSLVPIGICGVTPGTRQEVFVQIYKLYVDLYGSNNDELKWRIYRTLQTE